MTLPKRYDAGEEEPKMQGLWEENDVFAFDPDSDEPVFSIDTPPPYASADHLHVGHAMHYSQFEFVARYKRMRGNNVFFPMGFDDNGLPTERYVEKKHDVSKQSVKRAEFIKLCLEATKVAGQTYKDLFGALGFSVDWNLLYQTISDRAQKASQWSFIDLHEKGRVYREDLPTVWCTHCQTTIAQADLEKKDFSSTFNDITFKADDEDLVISTTRPELIPACVALCYHPDDERYAHLEGARATVPLTDTTVPIIADEDVDREKGTGLMMVCTFGDKEDIEKWRRHDLPLRIIFTEQGTLNDQAGEYAGLSVKRARKRILADLEEAGLLLEQEPLTHAVNVHERCGTEVEYLKKPQWSVRVLDKKDELVAQGRKINWYPEHMRVRYEHWVENLQWDWVISRQRYYGVPFPVWYEKESGDVVLPEQDELPVDPTTDVPRAWKGREDELVAEEDVMDTWMTSSVTPEINQAMLPEDEQEAFLPMSMRPQAHDIIRTWAFYTITKAYYHHDSIPWEDIMMSGHGQDPHGQKMSKSKGNFVVAEEIIEEYSADALRFWAASVKLGEDLPFQEKDVKTGQKTITKLWNAARFCYMHLEDYDLNVPEAELEVVDQWLLTRFNRVVEEATAAFEEYEYSRTKSLTEDFFWNTFAGDYLELVKDRLYNDERSEEEKRSAKFTLYTALLGILKLFAPIMPHVTERIYQAYYAEKEGCESIHVSAWPSPFEDYESEEAFVAGEAVSELIASARKYKSEEEMSLRDEIAHATITVPDEIRTQFELALPDFLATARIDDFSLAAGEEATISFE